MSTIPKLGDHKVNSNLEKKQKKVLGPKPSQ